MRSIHVLFGLAFLAFANLANAADDRFSCSLWAQVASRSLFNNSGVWGTEGAVLMAVPECTDKETGLYGNLFLAAPLKSFETGKEIDARLGKRFKAGQLDIDASLAVFYFGVAGDMYRTGDARVRVSRTYDIGNEVSVQPYGYAEYQRSFTFHANQLGFAAGAVISSKMNSLPGKPNLSADIGCWKYTTISAPNKGPICATDIQLGFEVTKNVTLGPRVMHVWGSVADQSNKPKHMVSMTAFIAF